MRYVLKELNIGEVLDVAVNIVRDNFKPLFMITLYLLVPVFIVYQLAIHAYIGEPPGMFASPQEQQAFLQAFQNNLIPYMIINCTFLIVFGLFVWPITNAAMIRAIAGAYLGQPVSGPAAMKEGLSRILPLLGVTLLVTLATWGGLILLIIPGIYFAVRLFLSTYSVIIEGTGPTAAMGRSWDLMNGNMGNGIVLGLVVLIATGTLGAVANVIPEPHLRAVITSLIQGASMVGTSAAGVVFYFSCRCKHENFDLSILANAVGQEAPPAPDTSGGVPGGPGTPAQS